jgi:hypothetical protein
MELQAQLAQVGAGCDPRRRDPNGLHSILARRTLRSHELQPRQSAAPGISRSWSVGGVREEWCDRTTILRMSRKNDGYCEGRG